MSDLTDTIEEFNQLDIQNSHVAYDNWLNSKKKIKTQFIQETPKRNGEKAFDAWLLKKKQEAKVEKSKKEHEYLLRLQKEKENLENFFRKQRLSDLKFQEWKKQKHLLKLSREKSDKNSKEKSEKISKEKSEISQKTVQKYLKSLEKRSPSSSYPHKTAWVDTCPIEASNSTKNKNGNSTDFSKPSSFLKRKKDQKDSNPVLSPPGLYKEYEVYSEKAPLFLLKYRNHVASGK